MPLHLRQRGRLGIWYARGTVRIDRDKTIAVAEFSTGTDQRGEAEVFVERARRRIIDEATQGPIARARRTTIADLILSYIQRPGGVPAYDINRLEDLATQIGHRGADDVAAAWNDWLASRGKNMAPATAARWRSIFQAALNHGSAALAIALPKVPSVKVKIEEKAVYLTIEQQKLLLRSYTKHARQVAYVLCYQGLRTSEALRLEWRDLDFERNTIFVRRTKSRRQRTVPMHKLIRKRLRWLWIARGKPDKGRVFLSLRGKPYVVSEGQGGNPLSQAHATACARAGITGFRPHDWRHHFASHLVMAGVNLSTLMRIGGWEKPDMVQRYASVSVDHMADAIGNLK